MRTAEDMYQYCLENGFGEGFNRRQALKHFNVIEKNLRENEEVEMTFIGLANYVPPMDSDGNYAYAITNERIIFAQKKLIGEDIKSVVLDRFNDISSSSGMVFGVITFDTLGEKFNVAVDKKTAANISKKVHDVIFDKRSKKGNKIESKTDTASEIRKFKELMDDGIISEKDFETKKNELLGL